MSSTADKKEQRSETKRGLFRRGRKNLKETESENTEVETASESKADAESPKSTSELNDDTAGEAASDASQEAPQAEQDISVELDLQRAMLARVNKSAPAAATSLPEAEMTDSVFNSGEKTRENDRVVEGVADAMTPVDADAATQITSQQLSDPFHTQDDDIEARLDAVLNPTTPVDLEQLQRLTQAQVSHTAPEAAPATEPVAPAAIAYEAPSSSPASTSGSVSVDAPTAASLLGIDVQRMVNLLEEEARSAQHRIDLEVKSAHVQAAEIVTRAEDEAERIREHGQAQARVLLSEVEEIISEAQSTGEQILLRANEEASTLRTDATTVLHQAQSEARAIIESARREGEQVLAEQRRLATVRAQEAMREQDRLKDQIRRLEERRRQVLESLEPLIAQLTQMMPSTDVLSGSSQPASGHGSNVVSFERNAR